MNIKIRSFFAVITIVLLMLGVLIVVNINNLHNYSSELRNIEHNRHLMITKADELRQSSDDLSKFANKYVITGNSTYKENYFTVLNIRNGKAQRPLAYEGIYWDLLESLRAKNHPLTQKTSLKEEMEKLPFTEYEFDKLKTSEDHSNDLVNLEVEAFNAMEGIYKDENGTYTIKGAPNQQLAVSLMNSTEYDEAKAKIMSPIDDFLISVKQRTNNSIRIYNKKINAVFRNIFMLLGVGFFTFIIVIALIYKKILNPIDWLTHTIVDFQNGKTDLEKVVFYNDEVGLMTKQFFAMKKQMDEDYHNIKMLALTDPLTNINNRRYFFELSEQLLKLSDRKKENASILMLDIDFFKKVNDIYGHLIGDEILIFLADTITKSIRQSDLAARFGGEEFIVFLPNTNQKEAFIVAEKIRSFFESHPYKTNGQAINITISIGLAEHTSNENIELKTLIHKADDALYKAKKNGRNRIEVF